MKKSRDKQILTCVEQQCWVCMMKCSEGWRAGPPGGATHLALRQRLGGTHGTAGARGAHAALALPTEQAAPLRELLQEREAGGRTQHRHTVTHTHTRISLPRMLSDQKKKKIPTNTLGKRREDPRLFGKQSSTHTHTPPNKKRCHVCVCVCVCLL